MAGAMLFERAQAVSVTNRSEGISLLNEIVSDPSIGDDDEDNIRVKEQGILHLGELYKKEGKAKELAELIKATRPFLSLISKAKAAKLVRSLVDFFLDLEAGIGIEVSFVVLIPFKGIIQMWMLTRTSCRQDFAFTCQLCNENNNDVIVCVLCV